MGSELSRQRLGCPFAPADTVLEEHEGGGAHSPCLVQHEVQRNIGYVTAYDVHIRLIRCRTNRWRNADAGRLDGKN